MKKITTENYYLPCEQIQYYGKINPTTGQVERATETDIINIANTIIVNDSVPEEIKSILEATIALYAYGYLYWTFFTLAHEQAYKAFEAAVSYKYKEIYKSLYNKDGKPYSLSHKIRKLISKGILKAENLQFYDAVRELRNMSFHPQRQSLYGHNVEMIINIADEINMIFRNS